jgi:hypothetical protein
VNLTASQQNLEIAFLFSIFHIPISFDLVTEGVAYRGTSAAPRTPPINLDDSPFSNVLTHR